MGFRLAHKRVRELLDYDPATGLLIYKHHPRKYFTCDRIWKAWNTRHAGKPYEGMILRHRLLAHQVIWFWMTGKWPKHKIDHDDGDGRNNEWEFVRSISPRQFA